MLINAPKWFICAGSVGALLLFLGVQWGSTTRLVFPSHPELTVAPSQELRLYSSEGHSHFAASALDAESLAPLTQSFQASLWASQHPADCSNRDFVIVDGLKHGLGSSIHVGGSLLLCAWAQGRVFLWSDSEGAQFTEDASAPGAAVEGGGGPRVVPAGFEAGAAACPPGSVGFACLFQRPSNCTMADARARSGDVNASGSWVRMDIDGRLSFEVCASPQPRDAADFIQGDLKAELARRGIIGDNLKYWARAQTAAYLMRLSPTTLAAVAEMRRAPSLFNSSSVPLPLPRGSVAMYMRQGDKAREARLVQGATYGETAVTLLGWVSPLASTGVIFTITDGVGALEELVAWHGRKRAAGQRVGNAALIYVTPAVLPRVDSGLQRIEAADGTRPILWLTRMYLLQLLIALEADGWVGTRSSNWGRIIDELRCVWVAKCRLPFVEAGANPSGYDW